MTDKHLQQDKALYVSPLEDFIVVRIEDPIWFAVFGEDATRYDVCKFDPTLVTHEVLAPCVIIYTATTFEESLCWLNGMNIISKDEVKNTLKNKKDK